MTFVIVLIGWIFSLCLHEFSHALVAYLGGDTTVKDKGYLTFNPLKYTHPVYSLLIPIVFLVLGGIGLPGGAVYIETWRLRSRNWVSAVSLAGPAANLILAVILGLVLRSVPVTSGGLFPALAFLGLLQVIAVVLNLIPLPPLDGYGVIAPFLPNDFRNRANQFAGFGIWILFFLMWYVPIIGNLFWGAADAIAGLLGVPLQLAFLGLSQFQFWIK
ncbi:MAG TPA: site-2 protease family protein [Anaerolineales bacterium]|nr:site-2 protease family protein [Anaerolineales bacterium]